MSSGEKAACYGCSAPEAGFHEAPDIGRCDDFSFYVMDEVGMSNILATDEAERFISGWLKKLRFAVEGPEGRFSTAWAAWEHADTIYIAGRTLGGFMKVSLHPKGGYRLAFTRKFHPRVKDRAAAFATRDLAVWPRPDPPADTAVLIASLCFPTDFLQSGPPPSSPGRKYLVLQVPSSGRAAHVGFFLSRASIDTLEPIFSRRGKPFVQWTFDDGSSISFVAWESEFDRQVLPSTAAPQAVVPLTSSGTIGPEDWSDNLTAMLWNEPGPGVPLKILEVGGMSLRPAQGATTSSPGS